MICKLRVTLPTSKLDNITKYVIMFNIGSNMLDEILQVGKSFGNLKGIGFGYQTLKKQSGVSMTKFVPPKRTDEFVMSNQMLQHPIRHLKNQARIKQLPWKCHYCGRFGHIKLYYYEMSGYPHHLGQPKVNYVFIQTRK
jgi:hypothetical protein